MGRGEAQHRIRRGIWRRVAGRGLALAGTEVDAIARAWALHLTWPKAVLWGPSALRLWDPRAPLPPVKVTFGALPYWYASTYGLQAKEVQLDRLEIGTLGGLQLQTFDGALVDTMLWLEEPARGSLFAWVFTRFRITSDTFITAVSRRKGGRNISGLARYVEMARRGVVSEAELRLVWLFDTNDITGWQANVPYRLLDGEPACLDFLFEKERLVIEVHGWAYHRDRDSFEADRSRQAQLLADGYRVIQLTWRQITEQPAETIALIRAALDHAV